MDAISVLKRTILLIFAALLVAGSAMAQITPSPNPVLLNSTMLAQNVSLSSSASTSFTFTVTETDTNGSQNVGWLQACVASSCTTTQSASGSGTSPGTLTVRVIKDLATFSGPFHGIVTLTVGTTTAATISVTFTPGTGPSASIAAIPTSMTLTSLGGNNAGTATNMLAVQNNSGAQITLANPTTNGSSWLSVSAPSPATVNPGGFSVITVTTSASNLANGHYSDAIVVSAGNNSVTVPVTLTVAPSGLTVSSAYLDLLYPTGISSQQVTVSGPGLTNYTATVTSGGNWLNVSPSGTTSATTPLTIFAGAAAALLATGSYTGTIVVADASNPLNTTTISITLLVNATVATSITVSPSTSLSFVAEVNGTTAPPYQTLVLSAPAGPFTATATSDVGWLFLEGGSTSGTIPGNLQVVVANLGNIAAGNYTGNINIMAGGLSLNIPVSLTVYASGMPVAFAGYSSLFGTAGTVLFTAQGSTVTPAAQQVSIFASDGSNDTLTLSGIQAPNWLTVTQSASQTLAFTPNISGLTSALYSGLAMVNVTNTANTIQNTTLSIPVVLTTNGGIAAPLTFTPSQLSFQSASSVVTPGSSSVYVSAASSTTFTLSSSCGTSPCPWISFSVSGSAVTPTNVTVSVNTAGLPQPSSIPYSGEIDFVTNGVKQVLPISLTVTGAPNGGNVTATPQSLSFTAVAGGQKQSSTINVTSNGASVPFTVLVSAQGNGTWLSPDTSSASTPKQVTITADPTTLTAGIYQGTVTITASNTVTIPVTFTVQAPPMVSAGATNLIFTYFSGGSAPAAQTVLISGGTGGFTATAASDTGSWLSVTPASGAAGANISVSVDPTGIAAGTHMGTVTIAGTNGLTGQAVINVSFTIVGALPSVSSVGNSASYAQGSAAPGEVITLFGSNLGPATAATAQVVNGFLTSQLGGVQVLVSGVPAPMIYASATQVSAVVPYEVARFALAQVEVKYQGRSSNVVTLPVVPTAPGIFTQNQSGSGAAGFNGDFSVNGPTNPAAKGSTVVFFLTGEGQTNPAGVTGTINSTPNMNPMPVAGITVMIGGQPATYSYAGGIEGVVEGIMQLNVQVPASASSGTVPVVVTIGSNSTQSGVTLSVK